MATVALAILRPMGTAVTLVGLCTLGYVCTMIDRVLIFRRGLAARPIVVTDEEARGIPDADLPPYTVLVPAYNEPEVVADLIGAMAALEYPREKLQMLLLLEADDDVTITAAQRCQESDAITIVLVPPADPRTKPKACNYGLQFATGEIITIYDAEDKPEPLQLRRVVAAFHALPDSVACIASETGLSQRPSEPADRLVHRGVRAVVRVSAARPDAHQFPYPAGRYVKPSATCRCWTRSGHWDPFNVTEDADLGLRIAASGYHTAVVDSVTLEEANSDPINWIRQRSRWYKGYLQTWLVHMRRPGQLLRTIGLAQLHPVQPGAGGHARSSRCSTSSFWLITMLWFLGQPPPSVRCSPGTSTFPPSLR